MTKRIFTEEEVFELELKANGRVQYDLGRSAERERILALLEHEETRSAEDFFGAHQSEQCVTCKNIARIEEEN
jgi:hypothetical protein